MKYKNIYSAIHNFGDSFTSSINYHANGYVIQDLAEIHDKQIDIEINWLTREFSPQEHVTKPIVNSIRRWGEHLEDHLAGKNVELKYITSLFFRWPAKQRKYMVATDDRGKEYKIFINEIR